MPQVPAGVPSQLLLRRPDVAVAERQMAAANATIGVQETNYFPALTLTGSYGFLSSAASTLFDEASMAHSIGGQLAQTVLDFGGRRAQVDQARNAYAQSVASYRQTVLTAFQNIENDLAAADIYAKEFDIRTKNSEAADLTEKTDPQSVQGRHGGFHHGGGGTDRSAERAPAIGTNEDLAADQRGHFNDRSRRRLEVTGLFSLRVVSAPGAP